jgi:hypothetical protein
MIRLLRFAFAAWAAVFALTAAALAAAELHPLEAYEGGSKQAEPATGAHCIRGWALPGGGGQILPTFPFGTARADVFLR